MLRAKDMSGLNTLDGSTATTERKMTFSTTLTTVEDLSYNPDDTEQSRDSQQIKAVGRRSWKTVKGKGEAVWGPLLEATLIEALLIYHSCDDNKPQPSKNGLRFPYRNRFISQYILEKTQKVRTHKQVGSRLQQMRDTCESPILALITDGSSALLDAQSKSPPGIIAAPNARSDNITRSSDVSSASEAVRSSFRPDVVVYTRFIVDSVATNEVPRLHLTHNTFNTPTMLRLSTQPGSPVVPGYGPLSLSMFSNSVRLLSPWELNAATDVTIYYGKEVARLTQVELLTLAARPGGAGETHGWVYECDIAASSWLAICSTNKLNEVTVLQGITPRQADSPNDHSIPQKVSMVYHFEVEDSMDPVSRSSYEAGIQTQGSLNWSTGLETVTNDRHLGPSYYQ